MSECSDFGSTLRSTRENLGWSLQDVAHRARIPLATLRQLEENDYDSFPSLSYAKSFLSQYCDHLGLDATEQLDRFETGDAFANLDSYEYLKDHSERVDAAPMRLKRPKRKKEKILKEKGESSRRAAVLQPLLVFSVTALLITGAVFGFVKLSDKLAGDQTVEQEADSELVPLAGISSQPPATLELTNVPRALPVTSEGNLVAGDPGRTVGTETLNATPTTIDHNNPPPRAVIVEE